MWRVELKIINDRPENTHLRLPFSIHYNYWTHFYIFHCSFCSKLKASRVPILEHLNHMLFHLHPFADPYRGTSVNVFWQILWQLSPKAKVTGHWPALPVCCWLFCFPFPHTTVPRAKGFTLTHLYNWKLIVASCLLMHSLAAPSVPFFRLAFHWFPFCIFGGRMMGVGGNPVLFPESGHAFRQTIPITRRVTARSRIYAQVGGYEDMRARTCVWALPGCPHIFI